MKTSGLIQALLGFVLLASVPALAQQDFNQPAPELGVKVRALQEEIKNNATLRRQIRSDRALNALYLQVVNQLQHVSWSFEIRDATYTHDFVIQAPYPRRPTEIAIRKAEDFLSFIRAQEKGTVQAIPHDPALEERLLTEQKELVKKVTYQSIETYEEMSGRLSREGVNAAFPELSPVVLKLEYTLESSPEIAKLCSENSTLYQFRKKALEELKSVKGKFPYLDTLEAIQRGTEFLDVFQRAYDPDRSPKLYHNARYAYYDFFLKAEIPSHIVLPTIMGLGATDILRSRGVPIGFIGINMDIEWVDGFYQTTDEFRLHDVNHTRRMWQFFKEEAARMKMSILDFARYSDHFVKTKLMPMISIKKTEDDQVKNMKRLKKVLLFEVNHEDALAATPEIIKRAILRPPNLITPFEMIDGNKVIYVMEPGATTLAYTYRKLAHDFYDMPGARADNIVAPAFRTRENIVQVADELAKDLGMTVDPKLLQYYVSTDQGFPKDFKQTLERDIEARPGETSPLDEIVSPSGSDLREKIAERFQERWQGNSGYLERWKIAQPIFVNGLGINDQYQMTTQKELESYFKDRNVPVEYQKYFAFKDDPKTGKVILYQDIQHVPHFYLAPNLQYETVQGSGNAADLIESIFEKKLEFRTPTEAMDWLKQSLEAMNVEWYRRNEHWARDYPEYQHPWKELAAGKQQNGVNLLKIAFDVETEANPNLISATQKSLLVESFRRLELEIQKRRKTEVRVAMSGNRIHELWQKSTPHVERWKPAVARLDDGTLVTNESLLRAYFEQKSIPDQYRAYFSFRLTTEAGAMALFEDIKGLPPQYLAMNHQAENLEAATEVVSIIDRIWDRNLHFNDVAQAERWIKAAAQAVHEAVLNRNTNGARNNPVYDVHWSKLPPVNQLHDLNQVKAAIETRLSLEPEGISNAQKEILLNALYAVERQVLPEVDWERCRFILGIRGQ